MVKDEARQLIISIIRQFIIFYQFWNPDTADENIQVATISFKKYSDFDHYKLYMNFFIKNIEDISSKNVRLNDLTIERILIENIRANDLNKKWSAEFDAAGMVRAIKYSLRYAFKLWIETEKADANEMIFDDSNEWYYEWWRGLQLFCGAKDATDCFQIRSSFEKFLIKKMSWKMNFRAIVQNEFELKKLLKKNTEKDNIRKKTN